MHPKLSRKAGLTGSPYRTRVSWGDGGLELMNLLREGFQAVVNSVIKDISYCFNSKWTCRPHMNTSQNMTNFFFSFNQQQKLEDAFLLNFGK